MAGSGQEKVEVEMPPSGNNNPARVEVHIESNHLHVDEGGHLIVKFGTNTVAVYAPGKWVRGYVVK